MLERFCRQYRGQSVLKVAGLNPHAGEAGHLGSEEGDWLEPCLKAWQARYPHCTALGPEPPDTLAGWMRVKPGVAMTSLSLPFSEA